MLIIAGVAVSITVNSGDIFGKTAQAREEWNSSVERERSSVLSYLDSLDDASWRDG